MGMAVHLQRRVDFPMVDLAGIMYYPQYWDMAHRFFEESWKEICGTEYHVILKEWKLGFPAVFNEASFEAPLKYGDTIDCTIWISAVGRTSCTWEYRFENQDGVTAWRATVTTVCVDMQTIEPEPLPDGLKADLQACVE